MGDPLKDLLKLVEAAKKKAKEQGKLMQTVAVAELPPAPEPDDNDKEPLALRTLVVRAVGQYLDAIKLMPRQLLEARYLKDMGAPCPNVSRDWLIEKMARKFQVDAYMQYEGEVPASVRRYNQLFSLIKPALLDEYSEDDEDEPNKDERKFDPSLRAKAKVECPFAYGNAAQLFMLVATAPNGIAYNALTLLLEKMNDWPRAKAEGKAQKVFTKWVDKGWVELI